MAVNYLTSVPRLMGRENYDEWCFAVENVFVLEGLTKCRDGIEEDTTLVAKAKAKLVLTVHPSLYSHVSEAKTAQEIWKILKNIYEDSGFMQKIGLLRTLISARLDNHESMESYINQIVETSQKLKRTGFKIDEEWIGSLLLAGLPEKFAPMIMAVEHSGINITTDSIKTKLLDMQTDGGTSNGPFAVNSKNRFKEHYRKVPRDGGSSSSTSKSAGSCQDNQNVFVNKKKDLSNIVCFKCKQKGHFMSKCPNGKSESGFGAVFTTGQFKNTDWYVDSGASVHLTTRNEWLVNKRCPDMSIILVANNSKISVKNAGDMYIKTVVGCEEKKI